MVDISILVMLYASDIVGYNRRIQGLHNAPADMEHDNNRDHRDIASHNSKHKYNPYISTYSHIHIFTYRFCCVPHLSVTAALGFFSTNSGSSFSCVNRSCRVMVEEQDISFGSVPQEMQSIFRSYLQLHYFVVVKVEGGY